MKLFFTRLKIWWYKQTHFEFFSINKIYLPLLPYMLYQALFLRSWYWFSYVNPLIYRSGMFEQPKNSLLKQLPKKNTINSFLIPKNSSQEDIEKKIIQSEISFPVVIKPDSGYRGIGIYKAENKQELFEIYQPSFNFLVQEFTTRLHEFAVFYVRYPNEDTGTVISLVEKEFMSFIGDGNKTLFDLIMNHPRAWLYIERMSEIYSPTQLHAVVPVGETVKASFIGSHNGGTIFYDKRSFITQKLSQQFDQLTKNIPEFYYGRYDVKADSIQDLEDGNFKILELNSAHAEPVHMYDPKTSIMDGYRIIFKNWFIMAKIAHQNKQRGIIPIKKPIS